MIKATCKGGFFDKKRRPFAVTLFIVYHNFFPLSIVFMKIEQFLQFVHICQIFFEIFSKNCLFFTKYMLYYKCGGGLDTNSAPRNPTKGYPVWGALKKRVVTV